LSQSHPANDRLLGFRLFALSFTALFLELMLIRWVPAVVRFVAYYTNLLLISSFLGLGVGALLSRRKWNLLQWFPLILAINMLALWGCTWLLLPTTHHEARFYSSQSQLLSYSALLAIFILNTVLFVPLGDRIGELFHQIPPLRAYSWDLGGSLCGTICFGTFSLLYFSPIAGLCGVIAVYLLIVGGRIPTWAILCFVVAVAAAMLGTVRHATWSPYHYITIVDRSADWVEVSEPAPNLRTMPDPPVYFVRVGRDFYQQNASLDLDRYSPGPARAWLRMMLEQYELPYHVAHKLDRVAIMGAGGGMDVQAALMCNVGHVDAVEIDPTLVDVSRQYNSSGVYEDPRVSIYINDARAFLEQTSHQYDLIAFSYLDSQSLFSSMASVRLDGFIYTTESMRTAWSKLNDNGLLAVSFFAPTTWLRPKLQQMIRLATGVEPIVYLRGDALVICAPKGQHQAPEQYGDFKRVTLDATPMDVPSDDWPYLYLAKRTIPSDYLAVISTLALLSILAVGVVRGTEFGSSDGHFFFMGLAFLLLQTKSITDCSLYFGTTWLVTTIVITGVLLMVLAANLVAMRLRSASLWFYAPLLASLVLLYMTPRQLILAQSYGLRLAWCLLVVPLPIFFAGLIFSTTFRRAANTSSAFGANLIGATIGGFCEYLGMIVGSNALSMLVMGAYVLSFLCLRFSVREPLVASSQRR
jgi:hypothetical protein